jgi:hypothetical protein
VQSFISKTNIYYVTWWLLTTQEAEIRRIMVRNQPRQIVHKPLSQKNTITIKGLVVWLKV